MRSWRHSGLPFPAVTPAVSLCSRRAVSATPRLSVDHSVALAAGDIAGLERLAAYMVRCPFSLDRIVSVSDDGQVVYRAESRPQGDGLPSEAATERSEVTTLSASRSPSSATRDYFAAYRGTSRSSTHSSFWPKSPSTSPIPACR